MWFKLLFFFLVLTKLVFRYSVHEVKVINNGAYNTLGIAIPSLPQVQIDSHSSQREKFLTHELPYFLQICRNFSQSMMVPVEWGNMEVIAKI